MNSILSDISKRMSPTLRLLALVVIVLAVVTFSGFDGSCGGQKQDTIIITYRPLLNFRAYDSADGSHFTAVSPGTVYTVYKILSIQNNGKDAVNFQFQPKKIFINGLKSKYAYGSGGLPTNPLRLNISDYLIPPDFSLNVPPAPNTLAFDTGPQIRIMMIDDNAAFGGTPSGQEDTEKTAYAKLFYDTTNTSYHVSLVPDNSLPKYTDIASPQILATNP